jgi:hypothetical protein
MLEVEKFSVRKRFCAIRLPALLLNTAWVLSASSFFGDQR